MRPEDQTRMIFRVGIVGTLLIASFTFLPSLIKNSTASSKDIYNLKTKCWTPAQFEPSQVEFADAVCGDQIRHNETLVLPSEYEEPLDEAMDQGATVNDIITKKPRGECFVFLILCAEMMLFVLFYSVMPRNSSKDANDLDEKLKQIQGQEVKVRSRSLVYPGLLLAMVVCFGFLMLSPHFMVAKPGKMTYRSGETMCTFKIRQMAATHVFRLQCFYSYEEPSGVNMQRSLMMNSALCAMVAIMAFTQFAQSCFCFKK